MEHFEGWDYPPSPFNCSGVRSSSQSFRIFFYPMRHLLKTLFNSSRSFAAGRSSAQPLDLQGMLSQAVPIPAEKHDRACKLYKFRGIFIDKKPVPRYRCPLTKVLIFCPIYQKDDIMAISASLSVATKVGFYHYFVNNLIPLYDWLVNPEISKPNIFSPDPLKIFDGSPIKETKKIFGESCICTKGRLD
jgi:hypothetical protein